MAGERGKLTDLQIRHRVKAGVPLAKTDGGGLTKQKAKATVARDWTVRDLARDYRAKTLATLAHSTQVSYGRHLKRVEKKLGALTVREIDASDVVALIEGAGLTWGESNMLLITTKCLFTHACGKRLINANPCHGIMFSALLGERPPRRQRFMLTREELKLLLAAPMRRRNALAIRILLATAVGGAEPYQAKWTDVDLEGAQWHIPKSKTGAAMDIPLAPVVVDWFRELQTLAGDSAYVLPAHSRSRAARYGGDSPELNPAEHLWKAVREDGFANNVFKDLDHVERALTAGLLALETDPLRTQSMTGFGWITSTSLNAS